MNPEVIEEKSSEQEIESLEITEREVVEQGIVNPEVIEEKRKEQEIEEIENKDVPDL